MYDVVQINKLNRSAVTIVRHIKTLCQVRDIADYSYSEVYVRKICNDYSYSWRYMPCKSCEFYKMPHVNTYANHFLSHLFSDKCSMEVK